MKESNNKQIRFLNYNSEVYKQLLEFNKQCFPKRKNIENSFQDRFINNPFQKNGIQDSFFMGDDTEIGGQFLLMGTQFLYNQSQYDAIWGMDYIVKEDFRGSMFGSMLAKKAIKSGIHFGVNMSEISLKIHLAYKEKIVGEAYKFFTLIRPLSLMKMVYKNTKISQKPIPKEIGDFQLISKIDNVENNFNQNEDEVIIFSRSKEYLQWRFFSQPEKYYFYQNKNNHSYFVLRNVIWKNLDVLLLVDYRYDFAEISQFSEILKATKKIAKVAGKDAVINVSSNTNEFLELKKKRFFRPKTGMPIVTNFTENIKKIYINFADSDLEHFYGDNKW